MLSLSDANAPAYFQKYIHLNTSTELPEALKESTKRFKKLAGRINEKKSEFAYAEGKWTLKEVLQHMIDTERVFVYRALAFSRKDHTEQPGFDENSWAAGSKSSRRTWKELVEEFSLLRKSTQAFFEGMDDEQLSQSGVANGNEMNVIALGFITAGHLQHHIDIIKERYLGKKK